MGSPENPGEEDLDQMWNEAQIEFQKIRGGIRNHSPSLEWMKSLQKLARKKKLMKKRNPGSLAADAASNAFGPSTLCFNAVSYLITPAQNYSKIFDGVADLFERIPAFLDGFEVYARSKTIVSYESARSQLKYPSIQSSLALEVFSFGTDKGVPEELSKLENLVQQETGMSVALILESVKVNESNVAAGFAETKGSLKTIDSKVDGIANQLAGVSNVLEKAATLKEADDFPGRIAKNSSKRLK
ncbi:hypothetical protein D8B26_005912 [Coccidioides posadasii str. Silveira]|uniref:uncharacterized protein n=1 Tax=Coccidioides posadasii (strain RMSCC 757 / Silveira) TaxID=443226 RepID=UPI001BEF3E6D|nr:hypothetical protein D8B26_005912 [Coccidioides posadasii str. Silveira]